MATATVYTIKDGEVIAQFDCDYNLAIAEYWSKRDPLGNQYYTTRKGVAIPYPQKKKILKNIRPSDREQSH